MKASSRLPALRSATSCAGTPCASTLPACIIDMRSQRSASFMKWVDRKMVTPRSRDRRIKSSQKPSRATGSTPEVGSSRISTSGSCSTATASDRRCRMPSGRLWARVLATPPSPKYSIVSLTRLCCASGGRSKSRACSIRFCRVVSSVYSEKACDMKPTRLRDSTSPPLTGCPKSRAVPSVGGSNPVSIFIVVVLPQPFEPRKPKISPRSMRKFTWSTAVKSPKRWVSPWDSIAGGPSLGW